MKHKMKYKTGEELACCDPYLIPHTYNCSSNDKSTPGDLLQPLPWQVFEPSTLPKPPFSLVPVADLLGKR